MAAKPCIEYDITCRDRSTKALVEKTVIGYPISLPVAGSFAVRKCVTIDPDDSLELWKVDHVESGFEVARGGSREDAITAAIECAERHGAEGFERAFARARQIRTEHQRELGS